MLIQLSNPINNREIYFGSKREFQFFFGLENYHENNLPRVATNNQGYVIRGTPTGFFGDLQNNPQTEKGGNQDGSDYLNDYKTERVLTWNFNAVAGIDVEGMTTWDHFNSIFNIKNELLLIKVYWYNDITQEIVESNGRCYKTDQNSWEAGLCQVTLNGNGLWQRSSTTYLLNPFEDAVLPYLYYESGTTEGATYTGDLRKSQFGLSGTPGDRVRIEGITANTPIIVSVTATTITDFKFENVTTGVSTEYKGTYTNATLTINSQARTVELNGVVQPLAPNFIGAFIYLIEGSNTIKFPGLNVSVDAEIRIEVIEYASSIS